MSLSIVQLYLPSKKETTEAFEVPVVLGISSTNFRFHSRSSSLKYMVVPAEFLNMQVLKKYKKVLFSLLLDVIGRTYYFDPKTLESIYNFVILKIYPILALILTPGIMSPKSPRLYSNALSIG